MEFDMEFVEFTEVEDPKARPSTFVNERPQQAMSADSPRHARTGGPLIVPSQPPSDRGLIDAVSGFINDVTLSASSALDPKDVIQWARFETADINEPRAEGEGDGDISPLLLILGYGSGVQVWLVPPSGEAQEVLSWRQGTVRVLRILPTPQHGDCFASKRPLIALCDSASPGPPFCSLSFISIRGGEQVKSIKFKNQILDVLANKRSVVVAFSERFAVFDAGTLEDRIAITTCYPCPCPLGGSQSVNPLALGDRWLAYADKKLHPGKRSSGGCEGEGVTSYTATVLHAAKSLSKGLRGLGESVAHSLAGGRGASQSPSPPHTDAQQPGVVTILDIEGSEYDDGQDSEDPYDPMVAHFLAHSEAIIALKFDASGMLLVTADRRGHDFHVFRINPHPCGPSLASVHHLYILHRGDTTAKVQDIAISSDSRWTAITTLRGTTHVFAISPYGGACGVRTHTQPRVVNRLSRFHRSAGLPIHATAPPRSGSPVSESLGQGAWFPNPRLPPYPLPVMSAPLAQLRPTANLPTHTITRTSSGRQRLSSLSEDCNSAPLPARARFGLSVMGGLSVRAPAHPALYLITHTGCLLHLLLHARPARSVPKEKVCDESPIEVEVEPVAQWGLARPPPPAPDLLAPLPPASPLLQPHTNKMNCSDMCMSEEERWLSQVEIVTHAGPHRRLWMGPQFVFKTYNSTGSNSSLSEAEAVEVDTSAAGSVARSNPVNMPGVRPIVPVLIDSGSASSLEHSPSDSFRRKSLLADSGRAASVCDVQLREDLAEAMKEDHGCPVPERRTPPRAGVLRAVGPRGTVVPRADPAPQAPPDPDLYTTPNTDETTFRPVVRAANTLSLSPDMIVRPLPRDTTIPVQNVQPLAKYSPEDEPLPLNTDVVIPAALTRRSESGFVPVKTISDEFSIDVSVNRVRDLERPATAWKDACESSVPAERESDIESLPKSNRPSDDIQPIARARVKKSPTPKSVSDRDSDVRIKEMSKEREAKEIKGAITVECEELREPRVSKRKEVREPDVVVLDDKIDTRPVTVSDEYVTTTSVLPVSSTEKTREDVRKVETVKTEETREKSKKSDKIESVKSNLDETRTKAKKIDKAADTAVTDETREKSTKVEKPDIVKTVVPDTREVSKKVEKLETVKIVKENTIEKSKRLEKTDVLKTSVEKTVDAPKKVAKPDLVKDGLEETREKSKKVEKTEIINTETEESHRSKKIDKPVPVKAVVETIEKTKKVEKLEDVKAVAEDTREKSKFIEKLELVKTVKQEPHEKSPKVEKCDIVKSEDQAWDLLLNESEKPAVLNVTQQTVGFDKFEEKPKAKKIRKGKKGQEELQAKEDEDSFIEIHAIEEAKTPSCGELVSISTPFEDIDATSSYLSKARKPRSSKSFTPERDFEPEVKPIQFVPDDDYDLTLVKLKSPRKNSSVSAFIEGWPEPSFTRKTTSIHSDKPATDSLKVKHDISTSETSSTSLKEPLKAKKSKSLSPYSETSRKHTSFESEGKDVYVIDSTKDEFPEIQITRGSKNRKKSPQPLERKSVEKEVIQPIKSWSSIAAAKTDKKEETSPALKDYEKIDSWEEQDVAASLEYQKSSNEHVSLQEKLIQLCKRTDIMVAECDAPTELNFVEEHHTDHDLPPLEPLDFGLDDYKLEVMRDSLLETNDTKLSSPICKININDILSSIKETTSKAIESSTFNLVDVEKVPAQKEKGFSVVEDHKITTQEVKIDDETKEESSVVEVVEKSSDEDNVTPPVSTDVPLPAKQSSKYKKSRRKKK